MAVDIISSSIPTKVMWIGWGLNSRSLDLQSEVLLTALGVWQIWKLIILSGLTKPTH